MCVCVCSGVGRFKKFSVNQVTFSTFWKPSPIICWRCTHTRGRALPGAHPRSPARRRHGTARHGRGSRSLRGRGARSRRGGRRGARGAARLGGSSQPGFSPRRLRGCHPHAERSGAVRSGTERGRRGREAAGGGAAGLGPQKPERESDQPRTHTHTLN